MNRIKELRKESKIKLKDLTEILGVSFQTIYRWEDGAVLRLYMLKKWQIFLELMCLILWVFQTIV